MMVDRGGVRRDGQRGDAHDPGLLACLSRETGMDVEEFDALLNRECGLKGIAEM